MLEWGRLDLQFYWLAGNKEPASWPSQLQWEFPLTEYLAVATDRLGLLRTHWGFILGHCGVLFRLPGVWSPRTCRDFCRGHCGVQSRLEQSLVPATQVGALALGHCGVQFRLTRAWFPQDLLGIQLWVIVRFSSADVESLVSQDPLGLQHWDIVGFSWGWHGAWPQDPLGISPLGHCRTQFRLMGVWISWWPIGAGQALLWGSCLCWQELGPCDPLGFWLPWDIVGFSSGLQGCVSVGLAEDSKALDIVWGSFAWWESVPPQDSAGRWCPEGKGE